MSLFRLTVRYLVCDLILERIGLSELKEFELQQFVLRVVVWYSVSILGSHGAALQVMVLISVPWWCSAGGL